MVTSENHEAQNSSKLRLGYLVSQYPAVNHTFILREIRTLRSLGFDIWAVSIRKPDRSPELLSEEEADECRRTFAVLGCGPLRVLRAHVSTLLRRPVRYVAAFWYAVRLGGSDLRRIVSHAFYFAEAVVAGEYLKRAGVRHFHTHFASTVSLIVARLFGIPFSATIHGSGEFNDVVGFNMAEKVAQSVFISTPSNYASSQAMRASDPRYWHKIHALPLGVDPEDFAAPPPRSGSGSRRFQILCVGQLAPAKAHHMLIAAVGRLAAKGRNVGLTLVGEGPERGSLERMIAEENLGEVVHLAGLCNHDRVIEHYRQTDAFALASFAEGVPVVLMEAMAMEIPCVATWITGIPELIRNGTDGLLVPPADPEALSQALEKLMDDPALCARMGKSARERILERYDLKRNSARLGEMFLRYTEEPLAGRRGPVNRVTGMGSKRL
jgi:glycosyltransferase involved in cell wall biosynthesis